MSSFLDEVAAEVKHPGSQTCSVQRVIEDSPEDLREGLVAAICDVRRYPATAIERALKNRGIKLPASAIGHHRRDGCLCSPDLKPPKGD